MTYNESREEGNAKALLYELADRIRRGAVNGGSVAKTCDTPQLGLATTAQLLAELTARAEVGGYAGYRTVGH